MVKVYKSQLETLNWLAKGLVRLIYTAQRSHINVLHAFNTIELFDLWLKQLAVVFNYKHDFYIGASSALVYDQFVNALPEIIKADRIDLISTENWKEKYTLKDRKSVV